MPKRPVLVVLVAALFIISGATGIVYHSHELLAPGGLNAGAVGVLSVRLLAIVAGVFLLRRRGWARWLAILWLGFHVGTGAMHSTEQFVFHAVLLLVVGGILFLPSVRAWFERQKSE